MWAPTACPDQLYHMIVNADRGSCAARFSTHGRGVGRTPRGGIGVVRTTRAQWGPFPCRRDLRCILGVGNLVWHWTSTATTEEMIHLNKSGPGSISIRRGMTNSLSSSSITSLVKMSPPPEPLVCARCKSNEHGPKRPMLRCSICKKGWHTCMFLPRLSRWLHADNRSTPYYRVSQSCNHPCGVYKNV